MNEIKNIATALAEAQSEMGKALKSANNPHFRSKYADLGSVMDACLPALNSNGIALIQPTGEDESGRYVETTLIHGESGESLSCRVPLIVAKNDMQGFGSAVTYARRYGLMTMAGIAPEDDDGNAAAANPPKQQDKPKAQTVTKDDIANATDHLNDALDMADLRARFGNIPSHVRAHADVIAAKDAKKAALEAPNNADLDDELPY